MSPKLISKRIRKRYYKTLGTGVLMSPMSPTYLPDFIHMTSNNNCLCMLLIICGNSHGSEGIRQWTINLCTSQIIIIMKIRLDYWLKSLEPTSQNSLMVPKVYETIDIIAWISNFGYQYNLQYNVHSLPV